MTPPLDPEPPRGANPGASAVLFDLDGTLVDTGRDIAAAVNRMLAELGRPAHSEARILGWVGEGAPRLVRRALVGGLEGEPPDAEAARGLAAFQRHYLDAVCVHSRPYPRVREVLEALREQGRALGCVTNKPERASRLLLEKLDIGRCFDIIVGGDTLANRKPHPEPLHHACRTLGVDVDRAVYVGDSMTDCRAAEAAGMTMVAVTWGYNHGADLTQGPCAAIIDSFIELPRILNQDLATK